MLRKQAVCELWVLLQLRILRLIKNKLTTNIRNPV